MSKHTSEQWEYLTEVGYEGGYPFSKAHRIKIGQETLTVSCHGYGWSGEPDQEAKARLIAAAPEMLDACKAALAIHARYCDRVGAADNWAEAVHNQLKAAIAKAEGEGE